MPGLRGLPRDGEHAVTLIELVIALFMGALLMVGVLAIWQQAQQAYFQGTEAADLQQNLRVGMQQLVRSIQAAGVNPDNQAFADPGGAPNNPAFCALREAGPNSLRIYADLNGDGDVADADENLLFSWSGAAGSPLTQQADGGPDAAEAWAVPAASSAQQLVLSVVANPDGSPMFRYFYGRNGGPGGEPPNSPIPLPGPALGDADRARVGRVLITLTARSTVGGQTITKSLTSEARPRNVP
jgi:type II secretory pathway component PulJ